jgi:hypothetical protein
VVHNLLKGTGLDNIERNEYATLESAEKIAVARELRMMANTAIVPGALLSVGKAKDQREAKEMTEKLGNVLEKHFDEGWDPVVPLVTVVGRKRGSLVT